MDKWQSEARHSRMKIKNAVRIIDQRLEHYHEMKRETERPVTKFDMLSPENLAKAMEIIDNAIEPLQEIKAELRPELKGMKY
jgi:hypothetical protein